MSNRTYVMRKYANSSTATQPVTQSVQPRFQSRPFALQDQSNQTSIQEKSISPEANLEEVNNFDQNLDNTSFSSILETPSKPKLQAALQAKSLQAKLAVGAPNDKYEQEADAMAAKVVQQINSPVQAQSIQRQDVMEEDEEIQMKADDSLLQRQDLEDEEIQMKPLLQRRSDGDSTEASSDVESSINSARGSGQKLPNQLRLKMENAMSADFSGVNIHTDGKADVLNRSLNARAFTTGQDVFFKKGEYNPNNVEGQKLIAHEFTHVVQQGGASPLQCKPNQALTKYKSQSSFQYNNDQNISRKIARSNKLKPQKSWETQIESAANSSTDANLQLKPRTLSGDILALDASSIKANLQTKRDRLQPKSLETQPELLVNQQVGKLNTSDRNIQTKPLVSKQSADIIQRDGYFGEGGINERIASDPSNPVAKGVLGVGEGLLNAGLAPINPRFWAKWIEDYKTIAKPEDKNAKFGTGPLGTFMQVLEGIALTCKNLGMIAGSIALVTGIAGAILTAAAGAGAVLLAIASVAGTVGLAMSAVVLGLKLVLIGSNVVRLAKFDNATGDPAEKAKIKAKLWKDGGDAFGALLGVISGGLAQGSGGLSGDKIGDLASTLSGQPFATTGDIGGSVTGSLSDENEQLSSTRPTPTPTTTTPTTTTTTSTSTPSRPSTSTPSSTTTPTSTSTTSTTIQPKKDSTTVIQTNRSRSGAISRPSGSGSTPAEVRQAASMVANFAGEAQNASSTEVTDQTDALAAMNETESKVNSEVLGKVEAASQGTQTATQQAAQAEGEADKATKVKGKSKKLGEGELEQADQDVRKAEQELGLQAEEAPKKPSIFSQIKNWLKSKFLNIAKRVKQVVARVKGKLMNLMLELTGSKQPVENFKEQLLATKAQVPNAIVAEQSVGIEAANAAQIAAEVGSKV